MDWRQEAVALINAELNDGFVGTVLRFRDAIRRQDAKETAALAETILQILAAHSESCRSRCGSHTPDLRPGWRPGGVAGRGIHAIGVH